MSEQNPPTVSRRGLFKGLGAGAGLGVLAGLGAGLALKGDKVCLSEALPADAPATSHALRELINTFNDFDQDYLGGLLGDPAPDEVAEGQRYLLHLLSCGIELFVEGDDERPEFISIVNPRRKLMGDNADAHYFHSQIRGDRSYRIYGRRNGEVYLSLTVHSGDSPGGWATGVISDINHQRIDFDSEGRFELILRPGDSGFHSAANAVSVISRHYYLNERYAAADPAVRPEIYIEPLQAVAPPEPPSDAQMARKIAALNAFIRANSFERPMFNPLTTPDWFSIVPNKLGQPAKWTSSDAGGGWGAVDNAYSAGMFRLDADEALLIEGEMPSCTFANVLLWNRYLQSYDYRYRQVSLNKRQMQIADDGRFQVVVAGRDPGVANWLDSGGRASGIVYWRFMLPEGEIAPIATRVVKLSELG